MNTRVWICSLLLLPATASAALVESALPWMQDPLNTGYAIAPYVKNERIKPASCPSIPANLQRKLTMGEVVVFSLCNNPDTRAAYISLLSQASTYGSSFASYFPTLTATANLARSNTFSPNNHNFTRNSGIDAAMTLYDFGQREMSVEIAEYALIAAGHGYYSTLQGSIAAALKGYYALLRSQNNVAAAEESEKFAAASFEAAKLKHEIGQVALADELQAKGSYSQAQLATQQAKNQLATDKAALTRLMGLSPDEAIEVEELDDHSLTLEPFGGRLPQLLEKAQAERVDLKVKRAQLESAKTSLRKTERGDLATVTATAGAGASQERLLHGGSSRSQSIGVSVSIPIFSGFAHTYNERAAEAAVETAQENLAAAELGVTQDVWNSWHNYQTSKQSWDTSLDLLDSSTQLKDVALGRYKEGIGTILDVLNAQSQYKSALQSQLTARYNLLTTRIDLVRAVGVLDLETMRPEATVDLPPAAAAPEAMPEPAPETMPEPAPETPAATETDADENIPQPLVISVPADDTAPSETP